MEYGGVEENPFSSIRIDKIADGLYLSSLKSPSTAEGRALLKRLKVQRVLSVLAAPVPELELKLSAAGIHNKFIEMKDHPEVYLFADGKLESALAYIAEAEAEGHAILVHCWAGVSRSVTCICAHLMRKHKWSVEQALTYVKKSRPFAEPNESFKLQLKLYESAGFDMCPAAIRAAPAYEEIVKELNKYWGTKIPK